MNSYLVCYDISDPKRLRKVARTCEDFGCRKQLSVFLCRISTTDFVRSRLYDIIDLNEDQVLFIPLAVWLIALANGAKVPRRLVYVVNRRTVVDQTTNEVEKYRDNSAVLELPDQLAISTLRGQFADNREWSADPSRPAVICGTVDMIGSRLLFSGYGCGFKTRPLHAGFLGQDALIVHDKAHLEPAFQELLKVIEKEQLRCKDFAPMKVMELTATSRAGGEAFELTPGDYENEAVKQRVGEKKKLTLHENKDAKKIANEIATKALEFKNSGKAVLVFVRSVEDVGRIHASHNPGSPRCPYRGRIEGSLDTLTLPATPDPMHSRSSCAAFVPATPGRP